LQAKSACRNLNNYTSSAFIIADESVNKQYSPAILINELSVFLNQQHKATPS
jgi:hypothetical protein